MKPKEVASTHNRLISFLVPIIKCDTRKENSKVGGDLKISQRLNLTKLAIESTEEIYENFNETQDLAELKESLINIEEILLLQSEIENRLMNALKIGTNRMFKETFKEKLSMLNKYIFSPDELIDNFTKPMGMHRYTIKALKLILAQSKISFVNEVTKVEIINCYREIITYSMTKLHDSYPGNCYKELYELAKIFYLENDSFDNIKHIPKRR